MSEYFIDPALLTNESDVEQKIVYKLLSTEEPSGLGYNSYNIYSKLNLRKLNIEKRNNTKLYYPDYVIIIDGIPLVVVEAKKPGEDLVEAYREARLYALEINSLYTDHLNPCKLIIATDGIKLLAGNWDNGNPTYDINIKNWISADNDFGQFVDNFCFQKNIKIAGKIKEIIRTNVVYKKPLNLLGGKHIQNNQIKNSFGETLSINYRHLFNPTDETERADIVSNAYVKVDKHLSHVDPIDRLIRKKISPSLTDTNEVENNIKPTEIITKLNNAHNYNNQVLLLIGSVGSGKSTFITYLKEVAIPKETIDHLAWIRIDLNNAPVNNIEIYSWIKKSIIEIILKDNTGINVYDLESIKQIYETEFNNFDVLASSLLGKNSEKYSEKLFDEISKWQNDLDLTLKSYIHHFIHKKGKEFIVVLDNSDKRNLEEQLLMFEVANWIKDNIKCIVFLPLRETTFDHFRNEKPLDTVIKDLTFRINPPSLEKVIYNRVKYADRLVKKNDKNYYILSNGIRVHYPSTDELYYLKSILRSLFQNKFFKRLISGLAGRDVRKGIEIFLDFCKSGHISESDIIQMKHSQGEYKIPNHIVSRVFLRGNRVYYSDSDTRIKNLFYSDPSDDFPNPFIRVAILTWLNERKRIKGPSGILGFFKIDNLLSDLSKLGHNADNILEELKNLNKNSMIISESQSTEQLEIDELISINSTGYIHLELLDNIDYLSSCAEDVWYSKETVATTIAKRISNRDTFPHFSYHTVSNNSLDLIDYLNDYSKYFTTQKDFLADSSFSSPLDFEGLKNNIQNYRENIQIGNEIELKKGDIVYAKILTIIKSGLICELDGTSYAGFLHISDIENQNFYEEDIYHVGQEFEVEIKIFKSEHKKYNVRFKKYS